MQGCTLAQPGAYSSGGGRELGCTAPFQSLDQKAVFIFILLTAGDCLYPEQ